MSASDQGFLSECVATTTGNPILEQIRDKSAGALLATYRLVKNALIHDAANQAVIQTAAQSKGILDAFANEVGDAVTLTFVDDTVFVCGQLLRASRSVYESAVELGALLRRCNISEVRIDPSASPETLIRFAAALGRGARDAAHRDELGRTALPGITMRKVDATLQRRAEDASDRGAQVLRVYASALVLMRQFLDSVATGVRVLPHQVKRLAQRIVSLTDSAGPTLMGMLALANAHRDDAGRAVQSAIVATAVGRRLTAERQSLAQLTMTALTADLGRVRLAGPQGRDRLVALPPDDDAAVPATTAGVAIATGGVNVPSAMRAVIGYEATTLERRGSIGPPYGGARSSLPQSQILEMVRALLDLVAPRDTRRAVAAFDAVHAVVRRPETDPVLGRVLLSAVGVVPVTSVVVLDGGEWAVVVGPSRDPAAFDRPLVRVVTDRTGRALSPAVEVDLATSGGAGRERIVRVLSPGEARFNVARTLIG